mmetsp:Transcript_78449/g.253711  ORF Transcript_78449/g.253711 Transcript_78449/m.253711 type:complete len:89 (+) Transcript_78449:171-437(+)
MRVIICESFGLRCDSGGGSSFGIGKFVGYGCSVSSWRSATSGLLCRIFGICNFFSLGITGSSWRSATCGLMRCIVYTSFGPCCGSSDG